MLLTLKLWMHWQNFRLYRMHKGRLATKDKTNGLTALSGTKLTQSKTGDPTGFTKLLKGLKINISGNFWKAHIPTLDRQAKAPDNKETAVQLGELHPTEDPLAPCRELGCRRSS